MSAPDALLVGRAISNKDLADAEIGESSAAPAPRKGGSLEPSAFIVRNPPTHHTFDISDTGSCKLSDNGDIINTNSQKEIDSAILGELLTVGWVRARA